MSPSGYSVVHRILRFLILIGKMDMQFVNGGGIK